MLAEIITIGDEILIGQVVDTNSAWMGQQLSLAGIRVKQITSVSDDRKHILDALEKASSRAGLILITGGLGPTKDDITKQTLAEFFHCGLRTDAEALENVRQIFARQTRPMLDVNLKQAEVLDICTTLVNRNGTAPGMWIEREGKIYVSMPGVPFEMKYLMEELVIPKVISAFRLPAIIHHTLITAGIGESNLAEMIVGVEDSLPVHIKLAYLPKLGLVRLRLSGSSEDAVSLRAELAEYARRIIELVPEHVISEVDLSIEEVLTHKLRTHGFTLSVAESCTGGYLSHLLTRHAGSSDVFLGGAVTYSDQLKRSVLGVKGRTLEEHGAVSGETVIEMAEGARAAFGSDYSIAISGIAGPGGGSESKPVGTVWIAVAGPDNTLSQKFQFGNKRIQNIERAAVNSLALLHKLLRAQGLN